MVKFKKILPDDQKVLRHRRLLLNIQITILTWMFELCLSCLALVVTLIGIDKHNRLGEFFAKESIQFLFTVFLPAVALVNDSELKDSILQNDWYIGILDKFGWTYKGPMRKDDLNDEKSLGNDVTPSGQEGSKRKRSFRGVGGDEVEYTHPNVPTNTPEARPMAGNIIEFIEENRYNN